MPMAHHRAYTLHKTYTQHGCQWLTIGLPATVMKHNSEPGGSPWDLYATKYADGLPWDLNATKYSDDFDAGRLHWIPAGMHRFTRDGRMTSMWASCPYQAHVRRTSNGGSSVLNATLSGSSKLSSDNITSAGVTSMDPPSHAGSTSIGAPDNMNHYLDPLFHTALPITITTTTTTYARVPSLEFQTQINTPCDQLTTIKVSDWPPLCISPPPSSAG